jgi:hypothetical protein
MRMGPASLKSILQTSVVEVKFPRRRPKSGATDTRRMLCTNCRIFLNTYSAREVFNFTPPTNPPRYNDIDKGLVIAFDLFMQQYRAINAIAADVVTVIPVYNQTLISEFWAYFNKNILPLKTPQKTDFMNV